MDNAAASLLGAAYANHGPTPNDVEQEERMTQKAFIDGVVEIRDGLGFLPVLIEPRVLQDNRWGRFFAVAYHRPQALALGLNDGTALRIDSQEARVLGDNAIFLLDLRGATLQLGTNGGFVVANGLTDVFAPRRESRPPRRGRERANRTRSDSRACFFDPDSRADFHARSGRVPASRADVVFYSRARFRFPSRRLAVRLGNRSRAVRACRVFLFCLAQASRRATVV